VEGHDEGLVGEARLVARHEGIFRDHGQRLADLEGDMRVVKDKQSLVWSDLRGNGGHEGLHDMLIKFISEYRASEQVKLTVLDQQNQKNITQNNKVMRWVAILGLIVAILACLQGYHVFFGK